MKKNRQILDNHNFIDLTIFKKLSNLLFLATPSVFSLLFLFCQCQEAKKGCLDIRATNFDVTADNPCDDNCCTYPNLVIETEYTADNNRFKQDSIIRLPSGDSINIIDIQFYISDIQLVNAQNKTFTTLDSTLLYRQNDTIKTLNNFTLMGRKNGFSFKLGTFNSIDNFTKLRFKMGLNSELNKTVPSKMPNGLPLSIQTDSLYDSINKTYIFNRIVVAKGQRLRDTLRLYITTPKDIEISKNIVNKEGFDATIPLTINYLAFFKDVNFSASENSIKEKIVSNYSQVFK